MKQIPKSEWDEISHCTAICTLPFSVSYVEENYRFSLFEYWEDGLATCYGMYGQIGNIKYFLRGNISRESEQPGINVFVRSFELDPQKALVEVCNHFKVEISNMNWVNEDLAPPTWAVFRTHEQQPEEEIYRFQYKDIAELVIKKIESVENKYIVRQVE